MVDPGHLQRPVVGPETFIGLAFWAHPKAFHAHVVTCPCGVSVTIPVNRVPPVTTPHPCGNPEHFTVKYDDNPQGVLRTLDSLRLAAQSGRDPDNN